MYLVTKKPLICTEFFNMGEIAEMMIDGTMCQQCGVYIESPSMGIPRTCRDCKPKRKRIKVKKVNK